MRMFAYAIDVSLTNAWIMYRRDIKALSVDGLSLKNFRIQVFRSCSSQRPVTVCLAPEGAHNFHVPPAPLLMSPCLSGGTVATPQMILSGLTCPCSMPLSTPTARPASTVAGRGTF